MELLRHLAVGTPRLIGSPYSFLMAIVLVAAWVVWGVLAVFSTKWLLWPSAVALGLHVRDRLLAPVHAEPGHARDPTEARRDHARQRRSNGAGQVRDAQRPRARRGGGRDPPAAAGLLGAATPRRRCRWRGGRRRTSPRTASCRSRTPARTGRGRPCRRTSRPPAPAQTPA